MQLVEKLWKSSNFLPFQRISRGQLRSDDEHQLKLNTTE